MACSCIICPHATHLPPHATHLPPQVFGYVNTLLGRRRRLPDAGRETRSREGRAARNHALRAAINTPIQGSAADVASCAMVSIVRNEELRDMGWKLLLQVGGLGYRFGRLARWMVAVMALVGLDCSICARRYICNARCLYGDRAVYMKAT